MSGAVHKPVIESSTIHDKEQILTDADVTQNTKKVPVFSPIIPRTMKGLRRDYGLICPTFITLG